MKILLKIITPRNLLILLGLCVLSMLIWTVTPHWTIKGQAPLASEFNRSLLIFVIFLVVCLNQLRTILLSFTEITPSVDQTKFAALHELFKTAVKNIKNQTSSRWQRQATLYRKPWFVVIGAGGAGKSSLLKNTECLQTSDPHHHLLGTELCDWWLTDQAVLLDVKGELTIPQMPEQSSLNLWKHILQLLKKYRSGKPCDGFIMVLDLNELLLQNQERQEQYIAQCKNVLQSLAQILGKHYPLYVVVNKCDLLAGFIEFFGDLSQEERYQIWGMHFFTAKNKQTNLLATFDDEFVVLLQRLNARVIWRLQHENNAELHSLIKDFPLQMETIKSNLGNFIQQVFGDYHLAGQIQLQGIYFTSSIQNGTPLDQLVKPLTTAFEISSNHLTAQPIASKTYFARQLFQEIIFPGQNNAKTELLTLKNLNRNHLFYLSGAYILSIILVGYWLHGFRVHVNQISAAENTLAQYQVLSQQVHPQDPDVNNVLSALNALGQVNASLEKAASGLNGTVKHLQKQAQLAYQHELENSLLPRLQHLAERQLFNVNAHDPKQIYHALKIYLMLNDPSHLQTATIKNWLTEYWQSQGGHNQSFTLIDSDLANLLQKSKSTDSFNQVLVSKARLYLSKLSYPQLAFLMLMENDDHPALTLFSTNSGSALIGPYESIPYIYTKAGFQEMNDEKIKAASIAAITGNWVIGSTTRLDISPAQLQDLQQQVKGLYYQVYNQVWQDVLSKTRIVNFDDLAEANSVLQQVTGANSSLLNFLRTVDENTLPLREGSVTTLLNKLSPANTTTPALSLQLQILHELLQGTATAVPQELQGVFANLNVLKNNLNALSAADDSGKAAFELTKQRMLHPDQDDIFTRLTMQAKQVPDPLQSWLTEIKQNSWKMLLEQTHHYINDMWSIAVWTDYKNNLQNKYPLDRNATEQISLQNFSRFFASNGNIDHFFQNYLAPFVDSNSQPWSLREMDGQSLGLSSNSLLQFQLASFIKRMYFPNNQTNLAIGFTLQPIALEADAKSFTLTLNGQKITFDKNTASYSKSIWPNMASLDSSVNVAFVNGDGRFASASETGPWAWFKILDKAHLQATSDPKRFNLSFDVNGELAKYMLIADLDLNPFIPNVINKFDCPDKI